MPTWKMNKNVKIDLPELTEEALENFLKDECLSFFLDDEAKDIIRKRFKEDTKNEANHH